MIVTSSSVMQLNVMVMGDMRNVFLLSRVKLWREYYVTLQGVQSCLNTVEIGYIITNCGNINWLVFTMRTLCRNNWV